MKWLTNSGVELVIGVCLGALAVLYGLFVRKGPKADMAQTLRYFNDVLALLADNTGGNISAVDVRDSLASLFQGGGLVSSDTPIVLPMTNGAWTAINPLLVAPYLGAGLWRADDNLTPDYAQLPDTVVPAGFQKAAWLVQMHLVKATSGTDSYVASLTRNGVNMGQAVRCSSTHQRRRTLPSAGCLLRPWMTAQRTASACTQTALTMT